MCFDAPALRAIKEQCTENAQWYQEAGLRGQRDHLAEHLLS